MQIRVLTLVAGAMLMNSMAGFAQQRPPEPKTIPDSINFIWKDVEHDFTALADAMPEDKWSFKPTQGEFKNVRTFAEQVKHVACSNEAWAKQISGEKPPKRCDLGGPNPAKSKAEIMAYLRDSFVQIDKVIAETNSENLLHPNPGPYWGTNRLSALTATVWHISDHYGQLVEYLRMNGIVPPASR
ncbi:MAG TPA: DinB family protein [Candidatus Angelobacter sp.]|nr:DinB family protein [Candidatus Angelobacter sp.]